MKKLLLLLLICSTGVVAQKTNTASFRVVPLGVKGGIDESNLSSYLVAPVNTNDYVCLDAGTVYSGIEKAVAKGAFKVAAEVVLKEYIKGYFISHAHLDHVSGLIITSPNDSSKTVYALPACMKMMEDYYFNGEAWANFGDEGKGYQLKKYHFNTLQADSETVVTNTKMQVTAVALSHVKPFKSTAFLLRHADDYVLYLGDTGPDEIEKSDKLSLLWQKIAPLIKGHKLKGIFIEVSFPDDQPDNKLFGHLTPKWLMKEMDALAVFTSAAALKNFPVVVTHVKPPGNRIKQLKAELKASNKLALKLMFPQQGKAFNL